MKDDRIYLLHIQDGIEHILNYTTDQNKKGRECFSSEA